MPKSRGMLILFCLLFIGIGLLQLAEPRFRSASHERQNQTVSMELSAADGAGFAGFWRSPRLPFSMADAPAQRFTVFRFEFPFHAALAYALRFLNWRGSSVYIVLSLLFSILSALLLSATLSRWGIDRTASATAAGLWLFSPLVLHYGQIPMPDILATLFWAGAIYALFIRNSLSYSSLLFALALIAKPNIGPFGLPFAFYFISRRSPFRLLVWGLLPSLFLILWNLGLRWDLPGSQNIFTMRASGQIGADAGDLRTLNFYVRVFLYPTLFGVGFMGLAALGVAQRKWRISRDVRNFLLGSMLAMLFCYLKFTRFMWREPQYTLPFLYAMTLMVGLALPFAFKKIQHSLKWRWIFGCALLAQGVVSTQLTLDLKASRAPAEAELLAARQFLTEADRVLTLSPSYGASPALWLGKNTLEYFPIRGAAPASLGEFQRLGFTHFVVLDYTLRSGLFSSARSWTNVASQDPGLIKLLEPHLAYAGEHVRVFKLKAQFR